MLNDRERVQNYIRRFKGASARADLWRGILLEAYSYTQPNRNLYDNNLTGGAKKNIPVYDTTAVNATQSFVAMLVSSLAPPNTEWAQLDVGTDVPKEYREDMARSLQVITTELFKYINNSNFAQAAYESYQDAAITMGALMVTEGTDDNPLIFSCSPIYDFKPEQGPDGRIQTCWRQWQRVEGRNIEQLWPDAVISDELRRLIDNSKEAADTAGNFELIEGIVYNDDTNNEKERYIYSVICTNTNDEIVYEKTASSPWVVYRWSRLATEIFGRGPVLEALPSIESLNKIAEYELRAAAFRAMPCYVGFSDDVFNPWTVKIVPNTIIPINRSSAGGLPIQPFPRDNADPQFNQMVAADLRQQINDLLFTNPFGPVSDMGKATATEVSLRQQQLMQRIGPAFGRLENEFLKPVLNRCLYILAKKGLIPKLEINGKVVTLKYKSPLAQAEGIRKALNLQQAVGVLASMIGQEYSAGALNLAQIPEYIFEQFGCDLDLVKKPQEIVALANQAKQLMQQQQQAAQAQATGVNPNVQQAQLTNAGVI